MCESWRQLHKNTASCIEQVLEATPHKTADIQPPTTHPSRKLFKLDEPDMRDTAVKVRMKP